MQRITILGSCGAGKSTLARILGVKLSLPVIHLDSYYWQEGWVETERTDWINIQQHLIQGDRWIIDGNYSNTLEMRLKAADTIIWLDFPRGLCLWRVITRYLKYRGRVRQDMAAGCEERLNLEFLQYVWNFPARKRAEILARLEKYRNFKQVIILPNPHRVSDFLEQVSKRSP
ncbi:DNA topology modulation protein [Myxosarcina sp. GI1(2024)]